MRLLSRPSTPRTVSSAEDIVEFAVLGAFQERRHLVTGVHQHRPLREARVAYGHLTGGEWCYFDAVAQSATSSALAPCDTGEHCCRHSVHESFGHGPHLSDRPVRQCRCTCICTDEKAITGDCTRKRMRSA